MDQEPNAAEDTAVLEEFAEADAAAEAAFLESFEETPDTPEEPPSGATDTQDDTTAEDEKSDTEEAVEPPNPLVKELPAVAPEFEKNFLLLSEQQNKLRAAERKLKEEREALIAEGREAALKALREDPWAVLNEQGWDADALVDRAAGQKDPASIQLREIKAELDKLKAEKAAEAEARRQAEEAAAQEAEVNTYLSGVSGYLAKTTEKFRYLTSLYDAGTQSKLVFEVQKAVLEDPNDGRALSVEQAASLLEAELTKQHGASNSDPSASANVNSAATTKPSSSGKAPRKTLTNDLTVTTPNNDDLSDEERDKLAEDMLLRALSA